MPRPSARLLTLPALIIGALAAPLPVAAAVVSADPAGFVVRNQVTVPMNPASAYQRFLDIRSWWNAEHSYSGDARNLSLKAEPRGCFCETLPQGGFVEHLRVILAQPGQTLRLEGALGPLQELGVSGAMTVLFEPVGTETRVTLTYAVSGTSPGKGLGELAAPVDGVLLGQLQRFEARAKSPGT